MMPMRNKLKFAFWTKLLSAVAITASLSSCSENSAGMNDDFAPNFWEKRDDFSSVDAYYLDAKVWIDREAGQYLALQFQCFRHIGAQVSIDQTLIINSSVDSKLSGQTAKYFDAVLFKSGDGGPRIYNNTYNGSVLSNFQDANLNLGDMLSLDGSENYRSLKIRFVYGASPVTAQLGDVDALSRADSVDFDLSITGQETGKFLRACAPVKNWVPPK